MEYRIEKDTMGKVQVPAHVYWGAQTQRSIENFPIGGHRMPLPLIRALGLQKKAAAEVNAELGILKPELAKAIVSAADEVAVARLDLDLDRLGRGCEVEGAAFAERRHAGMVSERRAEVAKWRSGKVAE